MAQHHQHLLVMNPDPRAARTSAGLSQEELAHRAGVSIRYISLLESRKHQPSLATLKSLSDGLEITLVAFVTDVQDRYSLASSSDQK
ncbi:helix-turn-helix transcriptional regulator [Ruegeria sp. R8_2]|nr:helix-turn-helix transcriptional regulator [Ruegeria sp. R8_1]MBO9415761.1 helix-turn-helix transcriptional regulator [Ruegeria sp. R8_2]